MKILFCLLLIISIRVHGQGYPQFNPLIDIYNKEHTKKAFNLLTHSNAFKGKLTEDSIITGLYQGQKIQVKKINDVFQVELHFQQKNDYLKFLKAANLFFVKDELTNDSSFGNSRTCNIQNFKKPDFKTENLIVAFADCLSPTKLQHDYSMHLEPGPKFCGNKF